MTDADGEGKEIRQGSWVREWGPVVVYILLILVVSSVPRLRPPGSLAGQDKIAHVVEYAILGILLCRAIPFQRVWGWLMVVVVGAAIGWVDEWYQSFIPGRWRSTDDWLADLVGVCLGVGFWMIVARRLAASRKRESRRK